MAWRRSGDKPLSESMVVDMWPIYLSLGLNELNSYRIVAWAYTEYTLRWIPQKLTDKKPTLVQVMAWCRQATSHYLNQCWPSYLIPYGVTRPQWVNENFLLAHIRISSQSLTDLPSSFNIATEPIPSKIYWLKENFTDHRASGNLQKIKDYWPIVNIENLLNLHKVCNVQVKEEHLVTPHMLLK